MRQRSASFNVVIYPPAAISAKAIKASKKLKRKGGLFALDKKNHFPHITVYMLELPLYNISKVRQLLRVLASKIKPFYVIPLKYDQDKNGYTNVTYRKSKQIKDLQMQIIRLLNPLRNGLIRENEKSRFDSLSLTQRRNVLRYGFRSVGAAYTPHLTLTKFEEFKKSALYRFRQEDFSFEAESIGLFYLGQYGTCRKRVDIFNMSYNSD